MSFLNVSILFTILMSFTSTLILLIANAEISSSDSSLEDYTLMRIYLKEKRPILWPPNGTEIFLNEFRQIFNISSSTKELNTSVIFDTCILSISTNNNNNNNNNNESVKICNQIINSVNDTDGNIGSYLERNYIIGCINGYAPIEVPEYFYNSRKPSNTNSLLIGYRIEGAIAALLLIAQLAYGFYHFQGFAFIKASEEDELT